MELLYGNISALQQVPPMFLPEWHAPRNMKMTGPQESTQESPRSTQQTPRKAATLERYEALASKKPPRRSSATKKRKSGTRRTLRRGTVLVVDDVPDVTEMIQLLLKHAGYDVSTAESAKDALRLARQNHYDLVISDIGMPGMNGYELAEALRNLAAYNDTPLIAVTGYSEYDDRSRAVKAGFNVHLTKPIEPAQLLRLMSELLSQAGPMTNH